jgi:hypothetical protein
MSVEFPTDQRNVADCPRSMERGSPVKLLMRAVNGPAGGGSVGAVDGAGGGGVGTGTFFLHPAAVSIRTAVNTVMPSVLERLRIVIPSL